jgi:Chaperone of endosialidase
MPADDLVLNVKQIAGYTATANAPPTAALLMQLGGLGGPYVSISPAALVATALSNGGDMSVAGVLSAQTFSGGVAALSNAAIGILSAQKACITDFSAATGLLGGVPIATSADIAALAASSVRSFEGRTGNVCLWIQDIIRAGGAPQFSPVFGGTPRAPTPQPGSNSSRVATTAFVALSIAELTFGFAPIDSPAFTGVPTAPTAALGSSDGQLATTAFVANAVTASTSGVSSFNTRTGAVVLTAADITAAGGAVLASPAFTGTPTAPTPPPGDNSTRIATTAYVLGGAGFAPIASPTFTGIPNAPTPTPGTNTTQLATTAFVLNALGSVDPGVVTFNGRGGTVMLIANDISAASGALLASPVFTGTPQAPTPPPGDNSTRIATTAFVATLPYAPLASPAFSGTPTAPTATLGTNTLQLATTAFVQAAIAGSTAGVSTFNGRSGAVTLQGNDLTAAGGALLASPAFTGTPSAPTAALGATTTQLATCAFVMNAASTTTPLMDGTAAVGTGTTWARSNHVHPTDTSRAAQTSLANYLPLVGGDLTGNLTLSGGNVAVTQPGTTTASFNVTNGTGSATFLIDSGGTVRIFSNVGPSSTLYFDPTGFVAVNAGFMAGSGYMTKPGTLAGPDGFHFNIAYPSVPPHLWIDSSDLGGFMFTSDYRIKTDVADLPSMWERAKALRPVSYKHKNFNPEWHTRGRTPMPPPLVVGDEVERWGFVAHELQETLIQDAASGVKDQQNLLQSPNPWTVLATLTRALQEAMTRIETLETRMAT